MKRLVCPCSDCGKQIVISPGNDILSYNIKCYNGHQYDNAYIDDILINKKDCDNICDVHKKKNIIICSDCDKNVCVICYKEKHITHKIEYLKSINDYEKENYLEYIKNMNNFIIGLNNFKKEKENYINYLISLFKKKYDLVNELLNNVLENNFSYFDQRNVYEILKENKLDKISKDFLNSNNFLEKYILF